MCRDAACRVSAWSRKPAAARPPEKEQGRVKTRTGTEEMLRCSFCHKSQDAVAKLISSPSDYPRAYICDECVAVCNSILEDDRTVNPTANTPNQLPKPQAGQYVLDDAVDGTYLQ